MKKTFSFCLMAVAMVVLSACSSGPGDSLKGYMKDVQNSDYKEFSKGLYFTKTDPAEMDKAREQVAALAEDKLSKQYEKKQGLKKVEINSEEISEDGNTAVVRFTQYYGDGTSEQGDQKMQKVDGKWMMAVDK